MNDIRFTHHSRFNPADYIGYDVAADRQPLHRVYLSLYEGYQAEGSDWYFAALKFLWLFPVGKWDGNIDSVRGLIVAYDDTRTQEISK